MKGKKAQVEITFHWVYILIAGAVILLFFAGIVIKQKAASEEELGRDVVKIMESILSGAGVSEKTKNFIKTEGLADYTFEFKCEEGYAGFGIKRGAFEELPLDPVFAPKEIKTTNLILWSLPYKLPYKVMDLLIATSINTKYVAVGRGRDNDFYIELQNATDGFNFEFVNDLSTVDPGKNFQVRIVDLDGDKVKEGDAVPVSLMELEDSRVTAVSFSGLKQINYFQKNRDENRDEWKKVGGTVQIISLGGGKDAAKYAAIFAGDGESYKCNMMKIFRRMEYVNEVYGGKLKDLRSYYERTERMGTCIAINLPPLESVFNLLKSKVGACPLGGYSSCEEIATYAYTLNTLNEILRNECIELY